MRLSLPLYIFALCFTALAQQPDRWHELIIDQSSPEDAIRILGKPVEDKTDSFRVYKIEDWITKSIREKKYRRLEYKNLEGLNKVILAFADSKLVFIELNPEKLDPDVLENAYGVAFTPTFAKTDIALNRGNYSRDNGIKAKSYGPFYYLYATAPKTFLVAGVSNSSLGSILGAKAVNDDIGYPGKVVQLQLVSRTLENKDGVNVLK
jgi:hypothetical protein